MTCTMTRLCNFVFVVALTWAISDPDPGHGTKVQEYKLENSIGKLLLRSQHAKDAESTAFGAAGAPKMVNYFVMPAREGGYWHGFYNT